jgi:hypothetical protein
MVVKDSVLRAVPPARAMRAIALSMPPHAHPQQGRRRPAPFFFAAGANGTNMRQWSSARPKSYGQRIELVQDASARGPACHCIDKAEYMYSSPLYICRTVFSCCDSVAALTLANCNWHVAEANISRPHPPTPSVLRTEPKLEKLEWQNNLTSPFGIHTRAPPALPVSRVELPHGVSCVSPLLPALFLPLTIELRILKVAIVWIDSSL